MAQVNNTKVTFAWTWVIAALVAAATGLVGLEHNRASNTEDRIQAQVDQKADKGVVQDVKEELRTLRKGQEDLRDLIIEKLGPSKRGNDR